MISKLFLQFEFCIMLLSVTTQQPELCMQKQSNKFFALGKVEDKIRIGNAIPPRKVISVFILTPSL